VDSTGQLVGLIFVLFREPLKDSGFVISTLQIFATRAASEFERLDADARIREQAALLDEATDAIFVRDLEHRIVFWSRGAEKMYGWNAADVIGRPMTQFLGPNPEVFHAAIAVVMDKGEWTGSLEKEKSTGTSITAECRWTLVHSESGAPKSILCIETDITERKKLEQQFFRAQRIESIGTLASGVAHDLNNSLTPVLMSLELLQMKFTDPESQDLLSTISASARRGADMVRQVLGFSRGMEGERMTVQVKEVLKDAAKIAADTFPKNVLMETNCPSDLWAITGDPTQLHQVLLNLFVNARDAMPAGGSLKISAQNRTLDEQYAGFNPQSHPGPYVFIQVEDTGIGMPPNIIEKIFDPFFTTKEIGKGTGLGLSTSMAIVKGHGGFLHVYSEAGKGTKFQVFLPAEMGSTAEAPAEAAVELPRGHGELILVVDDEASVRQITKRTLEAFGYRGILASDGSDAVAIYASRGAEIAAVLTDMMMPVMDGVETIVALRNMNPEVHIIASSGLSANNPVAHAARLGVKHFLPKPYTAESLLRALRAILSA